MSEKEESWEKYLFPAIEFLPCYIPFAGLCEALWERRKVYDPPEETDPGTGEEVERRNPYRPGLFSVCSSGQDEARAFDRQLWDVAGHYINHLKADFETLTDIPFWNREALCEALDEELVDPEKDLMRPEWSVEWALQRRRMINLLKFAQIDYLCSYVNGSTHNGEPMSPGAAIDAAMSGVTAGDSVKNASIARTTTTIWGPDHGWKDGSYCADVYQCGNISAVLPDELKGSDIRLYLSVDSPDADPANFDAYGTGIIPGLNMLYADEDGNFTTDWTLPGSPDNVRVPVEGKTETFGFIARKVFCCTDFSAVFKFKENDDEGE